MDLTDKSAFYICVISCNKMARLGLSRLLYVVCRHAVYFMLKTPNVAYTLLRKYVLSFLKKIDFSIEKVDSSYI